MSKKQRDTSAQPRKLRLDRTTLRTLDTSDLEKVAGGTRNSGKLCDLTRGRI